MSDYTGENRLLEKIEIYFEIFRINAVTLEINLIKLKIETNFIRRNFGLISRREIMKRSNEDLGWFEMIFLIFNQYLILKLIKNLNRAISSGLLNFKQEMKKSNLCKNLHRNKRKDCLTFV
ncbi:hypothetical protein BpHYR1_028971 [Brachionus plicatilis]|uniref:Uncharacterized protein n=1 Tax=Brachionus plicatilis TaxID=10195 RepID=A0A3M7RUN7_BRAPC|nr:hypothetical protein BpHYR1_028971 [Brachionus plicatilis]